MPALLEAHAVRMVFARRSPPAVDGISLAIGGARAGILAVVGESGSGKTTLTRLLLGFLRPTGGSVRYRGTDLAALRGEQRGAFRREVQAIFQDPYEAFNPFHRIDRTLQMPLRNFRLARSTADARAQIEVALQAVGLRPQETLGRYPHQFSGGQRQRIMIARALLLHPRIILADEPVSMVDASLRATILESIFRLKADLGISVVYVTHDLATAYQIADHAVVLYRGKIVEAGPVQAVIGQPMHPYTRLLVDAVPRSDPDASWGLEDAPEPAQGPAGDGCAFAPRCVHAMPQCRREVPPLVRTEVGGAAACFLYRGGPVVGVAEMTGAEEQ
jgi:peptide/nickel transport system ATP-binding protein